MDWRAVVGRANQVKNIVEWYLIFAALGLVPAAAVVIAVWEGVSWSELALYGMAAIAFWIVLLAEGPAALNYLLTPADEINDEEIEAMRRELIVAWRARLSGHPFGVGLDLLHRENEEYLVYQRDHGTLPYTRGKIHRFQDAEKARIRKINPRMWKWYLECPMGSPPDELLAG